MTRTLLDECFRIGGRTKWYATPEEPRTDLDAFLVFYNFVRGHRGYRVAGRTPAATRARGGPYGQLIDRPSRGAGVAEILDEYRQTPSASAPTSPAFSGPAIKSGSVYSICVAPVQAQPTLVTGPDGARPRRPTTGSAG